MITFTRNKAVGVEELPGGGFAAHGLLDDDIYSLRVELAVQGPELVLERLEGVWQRYTTPDCPRAIGYLPSVLGLSITDPQFAPAVHKQVGRQACRHFANLILECAQSIIQARALLAGELASQAGPGRQGGQASGSGSQEPAREPDQAEPQARLGGHRERYESLAPAPEGFFLDLHLHTFPASACASSSVEEMIAEAQRLGLDGICLTDHNYLWPAPELEDLRQKHGFLILGGNEVTTAQGDVVVFGLEEPVPQVAPLGQLCALVTRAKGFLIAAHPFRGFLAVGLDDLGLDAAKAAQRPMFSQVHALEGLNSKVTASENALARRVAARLGRPCTGGSDAHQVQEVGVFATRFDRVIQNEADLVAALHHGSYTAVAFRGAKEVDLS